MINPRCTRIQVSGFQVGLPKPESSIGGLRPTGPAQRYDQCKEE